MQSFYTFKLYSDNAFSDLQLFDGKNRKLYRLC